MKTSGHGGKRKGAGKPKGVLWPSTLAKIEAREQTRQYVTQRIPGMLEAQVLHAQGINHMMLRGPDGKFERATDPDQIIAALNSGDENSYYIFTKDPSVQAFTDLMNRALDKPSEPVQEHAHKGEFVVRHILD